MIKTIAITGATGFLGRCLVKDLAAAGHKVKALTRNKCTAPFGENDSVKLVQIDWDNAASVKAAVSDCDFVVHCAAAHPSRTLRGKESIINFNVGGTKKLLEALGQVKRLVMVSSMRALINKHSGGIFDEDSRYDFERFDTPYGYSKFLSEQVCVEFCRQHGISFTIINPVPIIGPDDFGPSPNGRFILSFLKGRFVCAVKSNYGFVDVRDVSAAVQKILFADSPKERYVLCAANWPLRAYIEKIHQLAKVRKTIVEVPLSLAYLLGYFFELAQAVKPSIDIPVVRSSVEFAALNPVFKGDKIKELGFAYIDPDKTLQDSVAWLLENYPPAGLKNLYKKDNCENLLSGN